MKLLNRLFEPPAEQREAWARVKDMHEWLKRIDAAINGNGKEGLKSRVSGNTAWIRALCAGVGLIVTVLLWIITQM